MAGVDLELEEDELEDDSAEWDALIDKAEVCIATGMQPSEYDALTDLEREAFVTVINKRGT